MTDDATGAAARAAGLRLLLVNYEYPPIGGGAASATFHLARALRDLGHEVTVLTNGFGDLVGARDEDGVHVHRLSARRRSRGQSSPFEMTCFVAAAVRAAPRVARARGAEAAIVFFSLPCGPVGMRLRRAVGIPYVVSLRGGDVPGMEAGAGWMHAVLAPLRRACLRRAAAVVANSRGLAEASERADPGIRVEVVPNGVDSEVFRPGPERPGSRAEVRFLFVGRFRGQKNLPFVLDAFAAARARAGRPLVLRLVGEGPDETVLRDRAARADLAGVVEFHPWADRDVLLSHYRWADVVVNLSHYEGMPNVVHEAMACARPILASPVQGQADLVESGRTGLLAAPGDLDAAVAAFCELASPGAPLAAWGDEGRRRALAGSWRAAAERYVSLLRR